MTMKAQYYQICNFQCRILLRLKNLETNLIDLKTASVAFDFGSRYFAQTHVRKFLGYQHYLELDILMEGS